MGIGEDLKSKVAREEWLNKRRSWLRNACGAGIVSVVCLSSLASNAGEATHGAIVLLVLFSVVFCLYCLYQRSTTLPSSKAVSSGDLRSSLLDVGRIWRPGHSNLENLLRESGLEVEA